MFKSLFSGVRINETNNGNIGRYTIDDNVTPGTDGTPYLLIKDITICEGAGGVNRSVILPIGTKGDSMIVINSSGATVRVYPQILGTLYSTDRTTTMIYNNVYPNESVRFVCLGTNMWIGQWLQRVVGEKAQFDSIDEFTANSGVTIDGILIKDSLDVSNIVTKSNVNQTILGIKTFGTLKASAYSPSIPFCALGSISGVSWTEYTDGLNVVTKIIMTAFKIGTIGGAADKAIGALIYQFPALTNSQHYEMVYSYSNLIIDGTGATLVLDVGVGSEQCAGQAVALLSDVSVAAENRITGQALNFSNTSTNGLIVEANVVKINEKSSSTKDVCLNVAGTWAAGNVGDVYVWGTIILKWTLM